MVAIQLAPDWFDCPDDPVQPVPVRPYGSNILMDHLLRIIRQFDPDHPAV